MSETSETYEPIIVHVGYDGDERPVKFTGKKVADASNHSHQGSNQNRWHTWVLYEQPDSKYRVQDDYHTLWQGESGHTSLSEPLTPKEVVAWCPRFAEIFDEDEIAVDLDAGEEMPESPCRD